MPENNRSSALIVIDVQFWRPKAEKLPYSPPKKKKEGVYEYNETIRLYTTVGTRVSVWRLINRKRNKRKRTIYNNFGLPFDGDSFATSGHWTVETENKRFPPPGGGVRGVFLFVVYDYISIVIRQLYFDSRISSPPTRYVLARCIRLSLFTCWALSRIQLAVILLRDKARPSIHPTARTRTIRPLAI